MLKECREEAGLDKCLVAKAIYSNTIDYIRNNGMGCIENTKMFIYDLEIPSNIKPKPFDGEVDKFELWNMDRLLDNLIS